MLDLQNLLDTYAALKAHDNEIMACRPDSAPRGAWREENPSRIRSSFRVLAAGKEFMARINHDTAPFLDIFTMGARARIVEHVDLRAGDAAEKLGRYGLPAVGDMLNWEFRAIRERLGLTQAQLAPLLELGAALRVSEYERSTNPRSIPGNIARLMRAYDEGYRPIDWPA